MKRLIVLGFFLFPCFVEPVLAQFSQDSLVMTARKTKRLATKLYKKGSYYNSLEYWQKYLEQKPDKLTAVEKIANLEFQLRDYKLAEKYYKLLLDSDDPADRKFPKTRYYYALMQKYNGKYEESRQNFDAFNNEYLADDSEEFITLSKKHIAGCDTAKILIGDPLRANITHFDERINNPFSDYAPRPVGNELYFSSLRSDSVIDVLQMKKDKVDYYSKIYKASYEKGVYGQGVAVEGAVNNPKYHTGNEALSADGSRLYFTQCYTKGKNVKVRCDIYVSKKAGDKWGEPEKLSDEINIKKKTNTQPAIGKGDDGKEYLYFASDREGSIGGMDIWFAEITGEGFGAVTNAGAVINTSSDEVTPYYEEKTKRLFFSSNGHTNIGGLDGFSSKGSGSQWEEAQNVGYPLNSSVDDMYFYMTGDEKAGFFVSNRPSRFSLKSETCCDDIYAYEIIKEIYLDAYVAKKSEPEVPIGDADVSVFTVNGQVLAPLSTFKTDTMEHFVLPLDPEKVYQFNATKPGFWGSEEVLDMTKIDVKDTLFKTFYIEEIVRRKIKLKKIYYEFDQYDITKQYKTTLDSLYLVLTENPKFTLEITGHCDAKGTDTYNDELGRKRAQSAADYLIAKGIAKERLTLLSKGEAEPIAPNTKPDGKDDPKGRATNRRVEFKVTTNDPNIEIEIEYENTERTDTK